MKWLLDVDLLCALAWKSHARHAEACRWLDRHPEIVTSPIVELGFIRVSLRAYRASFEDAQAVLDDITRKAGFVADDVRASELPRCSTENTTDAHLTVLAQKHGLRLATLDKDLVKQSWAKNLAENPF